MKRKLIRVTAMLLAVLLFVPMGPALAAEDGILFTVPAKDIFTGRTQDVEMLAVNDRCYITLDQAAGLAGFSFAEERDSFLLKGAAFQQRISLQDIPKTKHEGQSYYPLETLADKMNVYLLDNGDGVLYFSSCLRHLDDLYVRINEIVESGRFDANLLKDYPHLKTALNVVGNTYDIITNLRFNKLWGKAQYDDYSGVICKLLKRPDYNEENLCKKLKEINKSYDIGVGILLKGTETLLENSGRIVSDAVRMDEDLGRYTSWLVISGLDKMEGFQSTLKDAEAVRKANLADLFFKKDIQSLSQTRKDDLSLKMGSGVELFGLSDILSTGAYYFSVLQLDLNSARTMKEIVEDAQELREGESLLEEYNRSFILEAGERVVDDYYETLGLDGSFWESIGANIAGTMADNAAGGAAKALAFTSFQALFIKAAGFVLDHTAKTKEKVTAVREMSMLKNCQDLFEDYLKEKMDSHRLEEAEKVIGAAELYLKCARNSYENFSENKLEKYGIPTGHVIAVIDDQLLSLMDYYPAMFRFTENTVPILASSLQNGGKEDTDEDEIEMFLNGFLNKVYHDWDIIFNHSCTNYVNGIIWMGSQYAALHEEDSTRYPHEEFSNLNNYGTYTVSAEDAARMRENDPDLDEYQYGDRYYLSDVTAVLDRLYGKGRVTPEQYFGSACFVTSDGYMLLFSTATDYIIPGICQYGIRNIEKNGDDYLVTVSCIYVCSEFTYDDTIGWEVPDYGTYYVYDLITDEYLERGRDDTLEDAEDYEAFAERYDMEGAGAGTIILTMFKDEDGVHIR